VGHLLRPTIPEISLSRFFLTCSFGFFAPPVSQDCSFDIVNSWRVVGDFTVMLSRVAGPGRVIHRLTLTCRPSLLRAASVLLLIEDDRRVILLAVRTGTGSRNCIRLSVLGHGAFVRIDHLAILLPGGVDRMIIDPLE
jgi:hypothetical protein